MRYISYEEELNAPFYTIDELCRIFELSKHDLRSYSEKFDIPPQEWDGKFGFLTHSARSLHNLIYKEIHFGNQANQPAPKSSDPWL